MKFVLVHSPVVGPSTWLWVADALVELGHDAVALDLTAAAESGRPAEFVQAAQAAVRGDEEFMLVGHSGAGPLLPLIAKGTTASGRLVFVDAGLPPCEGTFTAGGGFLPSLRQLAVEGLLPPWSGWFGDGVMDALVPDENRRRAVDAELPRVPLGFYETELEVPTGWCSAAGGYILCSEPYRNDAERAATLGWPLIEMPGTHLDIVNTPHAIARALSGSLHSL